MPKQHDASDPESWSNSSEQQFYAELLRLGIPPSAVSYWPAALVVSEHRRYQPDFGLVDPRTRTLLAVLECNSPTADMGAAAECLAAYATATQDRSIRAYERLIALAVSLALLIVPFLQKLKALGVEIERASRKVGHEH